MRETINALRAAADALSRPAFQAILRALRQGPQDLKVLKGTTGLDMASLRAFTTRLSFLGAIRKKGAKYELTEEGMAAVSGAAFTDESGQFWGNEGAGGIFYARDTGRVLVQHRSQHVNEPGTWGVFGGAIDPGERPEQGLKREVQEETEYRGAFDLEKVFTFTKGKFKYHNYLIVVPTEFNPKHSWESVGHRWVDVDAMPQPLHFGLKAALPHYKRAVEKLGTVRAAVVRASQKSQIERLQPNTPVVLFHGSSPDDVRLFVQNGIDARKPVSRRFPHTVWLKHLNKSIIVNRGMFVTPFLKTAMDFGGVAIKFKTLGKNLVPPFPNLDFMREEDKSWSKKFPRSFRPTVTANLLGTAWKNEPQALLRGVVSPRAIERVYLHTNDVYGWPGKVEKAGVPFKEGKAGYATYVSVSPEDFLKVIDLSDAKVRPERWLAEPQERIRFDEYISRIMQEFKIGKAELLKILQQQLKRTQTYEQQVDIFVKPAGGSELYPYSVAKRVVQEGLKKLGLQPLPSDAAGPQVYYGY